MRPELFKKWIRSPRLRYRLGRYLPSSLGVWNFKIVHDAECWNVVKIARRGRTIEVRLAGRNEIVDDHIHYYYRTFLPVIVYLLSRTSVRVDGAVAELSDGSATASDNLLFSANFVDAVLVPDPYFFNSSGYAEARRRLTAQRPWHERCEEIVWRGATTGSGRQIGDGLDFRAPDILQRIRMCAMLADASHVDAKIYRVVQNSNEQEVVKRLRQARLLGSYVPEPTWIDLKFAIDVDGNTNAWSNLFTRMIYGCCVIKIGSKHGFRQWYYDRLVPWKHFIPVQDDLSDLLERVEWCRSHLSECANIAAAGQQLALSMTFESEMRHGIHRINQRLG
jgi:Glycosyl transferase family 90